MRPRSRYCPRCGRGNDGRSMFCQEYLPWPEKVCGHLQPGWLFWLMARWLFERGSHTEDVVMRKVQRLA